MRIKLEIQTREWERAVSRLVDEQMPFATALALTGAAFDARSALQRELPRHFTIRAPWVARGIRVEKATKRALRAAVGSVDPFMSTQATGGRKVAGPAGIQAIPVAARPTPEARTPRSMWPAAMLRRKRLGLFVREAPSGVGAEIVKPEEKPGDGLEVVYRLVPRVWVPERWPLRETVRRVAAAVFPRHMERAFEKALKTARR